MTAAVNQLSKAGSRALGQILGKTKCNYDLGYVSYSKLFHSCVVPVLDYGSGVWSQGRDCSKIDQIQSQACRYYCGLPKGAPLVGVAAEMGWAPGIVRRDAETLRLYNQLVNLPVSHLNRKVFVYEHELCLDGSWSANIKSLCASMEMLDNWKNLRPVPLKIVQEKLNNMYESELLSAIGGKPKLQTYKHLKDNIGVENYLKANVAKHKRSLICQLRLGILPLALETGRYQKIPAAERVCKLCNNAVETEIHFLFHCEALAAVRRSALVKIPELPCVSSDYEKLKYLSNMPYVFGTLIDKLWNQREVMIEELDN